MRRREQKPVASMRTREPSHLGNDQSGPAGRPASNSSVEEDRYGSNPDVTL